MERVIVVSADAELIPQIASLDLYTGIRYERIPLGGTSSQSIPLSFELKGSSEGKAKRVTVIARGGDGRVLALRVADVPGLEGRRAGWLLHLSAACEPTCATGCGRCGDCESVEVDPSQLVPLADGDDGLRLAEAPLVCEPRNPPVEGDGDGDGDGNDDPELDGGKGDASDLDVDMLPGHDGGDAGVVVTPISDASVDALTVSAPSAVVAPKGATVTATFTVRAPAASAFPLQLTVSSDVGQVLAADCASAPPTSMTVREITLCVKHTKPNAVRSLPITITATTPSETASAIVELHMPATLIRGGKGFNCATLEDGSLQCWGDPGDLRVPNVDLPGFTIQVHPFRIVNAPAFTDIRLGANFGCGLTAAGSVHCWGSNQMGQLGVTGGDSLNFTRVANPLSGSVQLSSGVKEISVGYEAVFALKDGKLFGWGNSQGFMFGPGLSGAVGIPVQVPTPGGAAGYVLSVAAAGRHVCAVVGANASATKGKVYCWGDHSAGRLGDNDWQDQPTPNPVQAHVDSHDERGEILVSRVRAFGDQACAEADGELYCWGDGGGYRTGTGENGPVLVPEPVSFPGRVVDFQLGGPGGCALVEERISDVPTVRLYCWGSSADYEFASTTRDSSPTPILIEAAPVNVNGLGLGYATVCVLKDGLPYCWGDNSAGQLGTRPLLAPIYQPRLASRINALPGIREISLPRMMSYTTCARSDSRVWCWGVGNNRSLGYPGAAWRATPVEVQGLSDTTGEVNITQVISQGDYACAIVDGEIRCWGMSSWADFGSTAVKLSAPVNKPARQLSVDKWRRMCALFGDPPNAEVYCWHDDLEGPIAFASGNIKAIAVSDDLLCAIVNDRVQCVGSNHLLRLGSSAVEVDKWGGPVFADLTLAANEKVIKLASRSGRTCAVTNLGDLWCWGDNVAPSVVKPHTNNEKAVDVQGSSDNLCFLRAVDGQPSQLWCEGLNSQTQLTSSTTTWYSLSFWLIPNLVAPIKSFDAAGPYNNGNICVQDAQGFKCNGGNQGRQRGDEPDFSESTPLPVMGWMN